MLTVKLYEFGIENTLREISSYLDDAIGGNVSKKRKDEAICKALGAIEALFNVVQTIHSDDDIDIDNSELILIEREDE